MIRLSEALARMRLDKTVRREDVRESVRLMQVATLAAATDRNTGLVDIGQIATGLSDSTRAQLDNLTVALKGLIEASSRGSALQISDLLDKLQEQSDFQVDQNQLLKAVRSLVDDDYLSHNTRHGTLTRR